MMESIESSFVSKEHTKMTTLNSDLVSAMQQEIDQSEKKIAEGKLATIEDGKGSLEDKREKRERTRCINRERE